MSLSGPVFRISLQRQLDPLDVLDLGELARVRSLLQGGGQ